MQRTISTLVAVTFFVGWGAGSASAGLLLDQSNVVDTSNVANYYNFEVSQATETTPPFVIQTEIVQTFQAGLTGSLDQIDVQVSHFDVPGAISGPLTLQLWTFSTSPLPAQLIAQIGGDHTVQLSSVSTSPGFVTFNLGTGPTVVPGEALAILLKSTTDAVDPYLWYSTRTNAYANGAGYSTDSTQNLVLTNQQGPDFGFKTYVNTGSTAGSTQADPVLPSSVNSAGVWVFTDANSGQWFDPPTTSGFDYIMTGGSLFTKIDDFPTGFGPVTVSSGGNVLGVFNPGDSFTFAGSGVSQFSVTGINPLVDPSNTSAYPLQLEFNTQTASFDIDPLSPTSTPEPSTLLLSSIVFGIFGIARLRKRLKRTATPA